MTLTRLAYRFVSLLIILALLLQSVPAQADDLVTPTPTPPAIAPVELPTKVAVPTQSPTPTAQATPTPTETPTVNPYPAPVTETPLPTPLPTETPFPSPTPTAPLTHTLPTETPPADEEKALPEIELTLAAVNEMATPGGSLGLSWQIPGWQDWSKELAAEAVVAIQSPPSLTTNSAVYDAQKDAYLLPVTSADEWLQWSISIDREGPYTFTATLTLQGKIVAVRSLSVPEAGLTRLGKEGGVASGLDGKVRVFFPAEAVGEELDVRVRPLLGELRSLSQGNSHVFEIVARSVASKEEVTQFKIPLTIEAAYHGREDANLFYYDEAKADWEALPSEYDREMGVVRGYSDHLTIVKIDINSWQASQLPGLSGFQVSQFSGSATYEYPIWTPPGPGGLQPQLSLSYNSLAVDSAYAQRNQPSWIGMGWSLQTGSILRDMHGTITAHGDDTFQVAMNGISSRLLKDNTGAYHLADENFWKVGYSGDVWTLYDKVGNRYNFGGYNGSASSAARGYFPDFPGASAPCTQTYGNLVYRWMLTEVIDKYGNKLEYLYHPKETKQVDRICTGDESHTVDMAIYLKEIRYSGNDGRYRIFFDIVQDRLDLPSDWNSAHSYTFWERSRLQAIRVVHDPDGSGAGAGVAVRTYRFYYDDYIYPGWQWGWTGRSFVLTRIEEIGLNDQHLPDVTFAYDDLHLVSASNGYSGEVEFTYESNPWIETGVNTEEFSYHYDQTCPAGWSGVVCQSGNKMVVGSVGKHDFGKKGVRPGSAYRVSLPFLDVGDSGAATVKIQYSENASDQVTVGTATAQNPGVSASVVLPTTAGAIDFLYLVIVCDDCKFDGDDVKIWSTPTYYRVASRTLRDTTTGESTTTSYQYDGPATNDGAHSALVHNYDENDLYGYAFDEFRGHAMVREEAPDGRITSSFYYQDDHRSGRSSASLVGTQSYYQPFTSTLWSDYTSAWNYWTTPPTFERQEGDTAIRVSYSSPSSPSLDWHGMLHRTTYSLTSGKTALVQFRVAKDAQDRQEAVFGLESGSIDANYQSWRVHLKQDGSLWSTYCITENNDTACYDSNPTALFTASEFKLETWYVLALIADNTNGFYLRVWPRDDPGSANSDRRTFTNTNWRFAGYVNYGTMWLDEYSEGVLYQLNSSEAETVENVFTISTSHEENPDLRIDWTRTLTETQLSFESSSAWLGTRRYNQYLIAEQGGTQYGNLTRVVESEWEAATGNWRDVRLTLNQYYPYTSGVYLVGLPGYQNVYACPANSYNRACSDLYPGYLPSSLLLSSHWYLYDDHVRFYDPPTVGILRGERDLLRFAGANYTDPRYRDVYYTYDDWGNRDSVSAYRSEGTYSGLYQGTASVTTTCYGQYSGTICTPDNYHSFVGWQRNAVGHYTRYQYDYAYTQPVWMSDANEQITQATYDAFGRMLKVAKPGDSLTNPTVSLAYYDSATPFYTEATQRIDASTSFTMRKYYNGMGWLLQTRAHNALVGGVLRDIQVDSFYNAMGKVSQQSAPYDVDPSVSFARSSSTSIRTSTTYDALGRVVRLQTPDGVQHNTAFGFDVSANRSIVKSFDPRYPTTEAYATKSYSDAWGRTALVQPPVGPGVSYTYDALDRLVAADYGSAHTELTYDYAGRKIQMIDADMGTWYYSYDASSNLASQTDARGCLTSISYDLLNRPTGKSYSGICGVTTGSVTYSYDNYSPFNGQFGRGYRTGMTDGSGFTGWMYDPRGRLRWESKNITGSGTFVTEWSYNSADLVEWMKYPGGNGGQQGEQVTFTYVPQMLVKTAYSQDYAYYYLQNTSYDAAGRSDQLYLGAPNLGANPLLVNDSDYNAWNVQGGRLLALKSGLWGDRTSLQSLAYSYDAAGNVKTILDARNSNQKQCFTYDLIHRLTKATTYADAGQGCTTQVGAGNYSEDYAYNAGTGNLESKTGMGTYTYGSASHVHAVTSTGSGWAFQYDLNGNATRRDPSGAEVYDLQYDAENRMVSVSGSATASFSYDGDGQRVKGTVASTTTAYLGNHLEYSNGVLTKYYYAGTTRLAMRQGSTLSWVVGDHLGSTSKVANGTTGVQTDMQLYRAWGENRWPTTSTLPTTIRYTGQRVEPGLGGIYFYDSRWYDPALSRWLSPDSIVPEAVQGVQAWDRYAYVNNSPISFVDTTGHCIGPFLAVCIAAGTFIAEHTAAITAIATAGALLSFVGPSNPDLELINNPAASQQAYADSIFQAGMWLTAGASALEFGQYFSAPASTSYSNEAIDDYLYRFSEPSGDMVYHLKPGEDAMSMVYANEFSSPAEAFTAMTGNPPGPNSYYQTTTVGTLQMNGYYPVYDGGLGGMPPGHVSVYGNSWKLNDVLKIFITGKSPIE